jgi:hypothetical protein
MSIGLVIKKIRVQKGYIMHNYFKSHVKTSFINCTKEEIKEILTILEKTGVKHTANNCIKVEIPENSIKVLTPKNPTFLENINIILKNTTSMNTFFESIRNVLKETFLKTVTATVNISYLNRDNEVEYEKVIMLKKLRIDKLLDKLNSFEKK